MLQIDHVYEFFYNAFKNIDIHFFNCGVIEDNNYYVFNGNNNNPKILFYDQEPLIPSITEFYLQLFKCNTALKTDARVLINILRANKKVPEGNQLGILVTSEISEFQNKLVNNFNLRSLYYFYHGYAALDWYRGYYALNYNKSLVKNYTYDYVSYNRIINYDRSYRIYLISRLAELDLLAHGKVSFNVSNDLFNDWRDEVANPDTKLSEHARWHAEQNLVNINKLVIDRPELPGSVSADIPRNVDALWNVVTETVFYYDKLHLTEKIFKPIVSKQPFMLLAAPGNLAYLRSYGFKTFDGIIDESYDKIIDNDARIDAVAEQLHWYCNLSAEEKQQVIERLAPIVEHNFRHFYGAFKHIITQELLNNCRALFKEIGYDDSNIAYQDIYRVLTN